MKVTYIYHSGYLVETEPATLLFDYYKGKLPAFPADKPLIVFASHKHPDHFNLRIFDLQNHPGGVTYVFGNDIRLSDRYMERHGIDPAVKSKVHRMSPHTTLSLPAGGKTEIRIHTLRSTDVGVAFYVESGNDRIYHAGDLNWWHWEGEADDFNQEQERVYQEEIGYLKELLEADAKNPPVLDVAFVPLDPRLGEAYCYGMDYFLSRIPVKEVYPMHMWEDDRIIDRYVQHCLPTENQRDYPRLLKNPMENHTFFTNAT